jgi:hypothetical protein
MDAVKMHGKERKGKERKVKNRTYVEQDNGTAARAELYGR